MTDAFHPDDELISAYLDGEVTEAEKARVESSPELMARVDRFAEASALASMDVPPLSPSAVDELIAHALDAGGAPANVTDLAAARSRRIPRALIAVAASVVALALAVPAIKAINTSGGSSNTSAAPAFNQGSTTTAASVETSNDQRSLSESSASPTTAAAAGLTADSAPAPADAESAALSTTTYGLPTTGLPAPDPETFDPLPNQLEPMMDLATLGEHLTLAFSTGTDYAKTAQDQISPELIPPGCSLAIGNYLDGPHPSLDLSSPILATDAALVTVGGSDSLVVLVRDQPAHALALVVDVPKCSTVSSLEIAP